MSLRIADLVVGVVGQSARVSWCVCAGHIVSLTPTVSRLLILLSTVVRL